MNEANREKIIHGNDTSKNKYNDERKKTNGAKFVQWSEYQSAITEYPNAIVKIKYFLQHLKEESVEMVFGSGI